MKHLALEWKHGERWFPVFTVIENLPIPMEIIYPKDYLDRYGRAEYICEYKKNNPGSKNYEFRWVEVK